MKKILAVALALVMTLSVFSVCALCAPQEKVPVVLLQGYSGPDLAYADEDGNPIVDENGEVKLAWPLNFDALGEDIVGILSNVLLNEAEITEEIVVVIKQYLDPIATNPDGSSKENLVPYPSGAAATRASTLIENGMEEYIPESVVANMAIEEVGAENVFGFTYDWRKSQIDYAAALDEYIQDVKELTGSSQVDLYGLSHGGQYGTTYLYMYGWKGDVRQAMFGNPATLGNTLCGSIFTKEDMDIPLKEIVEFIEHGYEYEKDWEWILDILDTSDLVAGANIVIQHDDLWPGIVSIPSLWDFVPAEYFDDALETTGINLIDNGELYADTVLYHQLIANGSNSLAERLAWLQSRGTKIGYISGYGYTSPNGKYNSDILIDTHLATGAKSALAGEVFDSNYTQGNTNCSNPNHYHISPEFNVDASTGFLPDSTWYVSSQGHGMIMHDEYTKNLVHDFLWGDIDNVYSSKKYPQFNFSQNDGEIVYAKFNNTSAGYHSSSDTSLMIKNLSDESTMVIWNIESEDKDITFKYSAGMTVAKGNVVNLEATDSGHDSHSTPIKIKITYSLLNTQMTSVTETFCFTPMTDEQMAKFTHLSNSVAVDADASEDGDGGILDSIGGILDYIFGNGDEPDTDNPNGGNGDDIPGGNDGDINIPGTSAGKIASVVIVAALTGAVIATTGVVIKKRDEDEE